MMHRKHITLNTKLFFSLALACYITAVVPKVGQGGTDLQQGVRRLRAEKWNEKPTGQIKYGSIVCQHSAQD